MSDNPVNDPIPEKAPSDFVREIVSEDLSAGRHAIPVTRFPPEPNGYLHIGHAKSICLNFGIASEFNGICNLRMDDTNPTREDVEYVHSIREDVEWLIKGWADKNIGLIQREGGAAEPFFASDYFQKLYDFAELLIKAGKAYVCDLDAESMAAYRGAPDRPGKESPWRDRPVEENLELFRRMRAGEFPDGAKTLRARIDMSSPNVHLRDPALYRIRHAEHHRTGKAWCIYPMYDYAHCLSDSLERITHSICTLEFEVHRPLYDWILEQLPVPQPRPHQYEFARLNLGYTVMSKRKLLQLVEEGLVSGWNDPRMPTIAGLRRRGVTASAIRHFCARIGVTKFNGVTDIALLEHSVREDLNLHSARKLAVLDPLKVVITNLPAGHDEELPATNNPEDPQAGTRPVRFSSQLYIERADFQEIPQPKFFRLKPGGEVRLKYAYIIRCDEVIKDSAGKITELRCTADLESKTGGATCRRKIKGTIHWVSASHAVSAEVRLYDRLFSVETPDADGADFKQFLNPRSVEVVSAFVEPSLAQADSSSRFQFERLGYFCVDSQDSRPDRLVFNRTISLKDSWARESKKS